jgi:hypothetical protein
VNRLYSVIFLVSAAALVFEVSLTRLFSIYLSYHFAFLVISIAMLGIGSAGTILAFHPRTKSGSDSPLLSRNALYAGVATIFSYLISNHIPLDPAKLSWDRVQIMYIALYCLVLSLPFLFTGIVIAGSFLLFSDSSERIYCSDLFGAGTGSVAVIVILNLSAPESAVIFSSILCFIAAALAGSANVRRVSVFLILMISLLYTVSPDFMKVRISEYKDLPLALKYPGARHISTHYSAHARVDTLNSPFVRFAPGLSLHYLEPLPEQTGLSVDGGEITAVTASGDMRSLQFLEHLPSALPYVLESRKRVLVLEPKGGLQVLMAHHFGADQVYAVESNPLLVEIIREELAGLSGGIFTRNTWTGLGRNWLLRQHDRTFDVIDLPISGTLGTALMGITEDYRFTVEAFQSYLNALSQDGILSLNFYLSPPPRKEFRLLATILTALEESGIERTSDRVIAIRSWDSIAILAKISPFSEDEIRLLREFSARMRFDIIYYPGISEHESNRYVKLPSDEYYRGFRQILDARTRPSFIENYMFNIQPVRDENPFSHYYMKLGKSKEIYEVIGNKWLYFMDEGYLLPVILCILAVLSFFMIALPVLFRVKWKRDQSYSDPSMMKHTLLYFTVLGLGFMFIEVTLIQKSILIFGAPVYAVAVVLTTILIASGTGSMLSGRILQLRSPYILLVPACATFIFSLIQPSLTDAISSYSGIMRVLSLVVSLFPLGFFMGIPFPMGMRALGRNHTELIPWAWVVNGCFSVIGFQTLLWLGSVAYLIAFLSFRGMKSAL